MILARSLSFFSFPFFPSLFHMDTYVQTNRIIRASIIVAALGYFVDIYDLILFAIVRVPSLKELGVADAQLLSTGAFLLNMQMGGMLAGGLLWGILGDKKGRLSVLFGSIFLYSIANIANGLVHSIEAYAMLRFIAGIGLAGELGAGVTLVSEIMPKEKRGYGTMIIATVGTAGAVVAALVGGEFHWRTAYYIGGGLGLLLLALRVGVYESGMFSNIVEKKVSRGNLMMLFKTREKAIKYLSCIFIGVPIWYVIGILITFSLEFGTALQMPKAPNPGRAIMYCYIGLCVGDFASGYLSQALGSRKRIVLAFLLATAAMVAIYLLQRGSSTTIFYIICTALGMSAGYWAVFVTIASEQFGTNIRATVTTTTPNFVRGAVVLLTSGFQLLKGPLGILGSAAAVGAVSLLLAFLSLTKLDETHGRELNYLEE
jgi:MFS family permease